MKNLESFDVVIVYTSQLAANASSRDVAHTTPFSKDSSSLEYNTSYGYFLDTCHKYGLKAAFTTSDEIIGAGLFKSYWSYDNDKWQKVRKICYSKLIFDKFSPLTKKLADKRELLFSSRSIKTFNNKYLNALFFDKYKTYKRLKGFTIPTVAIKNSSLVNIGSATKQLDALSKKHPHNGDFSCDYVLKDRFGFGGINIYKTKNHDMSVIQSIMRQNKTVSFVLQPFVEFESGFVYHGRRTFTDIRLIYQSGKIIQRYIRLARKNEFRCNAHQGGRVMYLSNREIPAKVFNMAQNIIGALNKKHALFALDFVISDKGHVYFMEGNTKPGIYWGEHEKKDQVMTKIIIRVIIKEIARRTKPVITGSVLDEDSIQSKDLHHLLMPKSNEIV